MPTRPLKVSENSNIQLPLRNLISIIGAVAVGVWAYFGVIERLIKDVDKIAEQLEVIKDKVRANGSYKP